MSGEEIPKSSSADVRKDARKYEDGWWEGSVEDERDARQWFNGFERRLKELGVDIRNSKVLEIGSGNNIFLKYLQKQGVDAVGVDARPRGETEGLPVVAARIEKLPFHDELFDVVLSNAVFDISVYNQDQHQMMEDIARVLKPGGYYIGALNRTKKSVENLKLISDPKEIFTMDIFRKS